MQTDMKTALGFANRKDAEISSWSWQAEAGAPMDNVPQGQHINYQLWRERSGCLCLMNNSPVSC